MSDVITIDNELLAKWRDVSRVNKRLHHRAWRQFKRYSDTTTVACIILSLGSAVVNLAYGLDGAHVSAPQLASGCLALVVGSLTSLASSLDWRTKATLHEEYSARFSELVREINTEAVLSREFDDGVFRSTQEFIRHVSAELTRLEDHAPSIPNLPPASRENSNTLRPVLSGV